jgi:hypothetical protein
VGLAGIARSTGVLGLGQEGQSASRVAGPFREVAGGVVAVDRSTAPGRRDRPCRARPGRCVTGVAVRPDGHRVRPGQREGDRVVRRVAKQYGMSVAICPGRRGNRKGVVEKVNHIAAQRWWRTLPDEATVEQAQAGVDRFARVRGDSRIRATADGRSSVATVAESEPLGPLPAVPYPVIVSESRTASRQALMSYRGNRCSVPPELAAAAVAVSHPVGGEFLDISTVSGIVIARHRMAADGLGVMVRDSGHVIALDAAAMATARPGVRIAGRNASRRASGQSRCRPIASAARRQSARG